MTDQSFALELERILRVEHLAHVRAEQHGVGDRPSSGRVAQQTKFERQAIARALDKRIHAPGVDLKVVPLLRIKRVGGPLRRFAKLQVTLLAIMLQQRWTEDLGEIAGGVAAGGIHFPEAVLRSDEPLRIEKVIEGARANMRHAEFVANNGY